MRPEGQVTLTLWSQVTLSVWGLHLFRDSNRRLQDKQKHQGLKVGPELSTVVGGASESANTDDKGKRRPVRTHLNSPAPPAACGASRAARAGVR